MRALVFDRGLQVVETPRPVPGPGEALVRVHLAGICGTDLEIVRGYKGFSGILGHEFVGTVEWCADTSWESQRVCADINIACGACELCRLGFPTHCARRRVVGILGQPGAFAEYLTVPVRNLHAVPACLSDEQAVFTEPLAAAFEMLEQVEVMPDERAIVIGDGRLGLLCAQVLQLAGARPILLGKHPEKLQRAAAGGIDTALSEDTLPRSVLVVEASGSPTGLAAGLRLTRPRGTLILKSTFAGESPVDLAPAVVNEITIVGSRCGPFEPALSALAGGAIDVTSLIDSRFSLVDGVEAMHRAATPGVLKVLLACKE